MYIVMCITPAREKFKDIKQQEKFMNLSLSWPFVRLMVYIQMIYDMVEEKIAENPSSDQPPLFAKLQTYKCDAGWPG